MFSPIPKSLGDFPESQVRIFWRVVKNLPTGFAIITWNNQKKIGQTLHHQGTNATCQSLGAPIFPCIQPGSHGGPRPMFGTSWLDPVTASLLPLWSTRNVGLIKIDVHPRNQPFKRQHRKPQLGICFPKILKSTPILLIFATIFHNHTDLLAEKKSECENPINSCGILPPFFFSRMARCDSSWRVWVREKFCNWTSFGCHRWRPRFLNGSPLMKRCLVQWFICAWGLNKLLILGINSSHL